MAAPYQVIHQPQKLIIQSPASSLFPWGQQAVVFLVVFLIIAWAIHSQEQKRLALNAKYPQFAKDNPSRSGLAYKILGAIVLGGPLFFYAVGYTRGIIILDRNTQQMTLSSKMTLFLPTQQKTAPLSDVDEAVLDYKPNSRRIRLVMEHGQDISFPIWTDRPGQQEAVDAINTFLKQK